MKLVIISHTEHYLKDGKPAGWGATVREIDQLATLFSEVAHIAPLHQEEPPKSALYYEGKNVRLIPVKPAGGEGFKNKFKIISCLPEYIKTILSEIKNADIVHVRCPSNISLIAIAILAFLKNPAKRWIKYAGNWQSYSGEAVSYKFQKWWVLNNFPKAEVTINGEWPNQPKHIHSFYNPCISEQERQEALRVTLDKELTQPIQLLFVGRLENEKGVDCILKIAKCLDEQNIQYELNLVGDGPRRHEYEKEACQLQKKVFFHGWLSREKVNSLYEQAHFILLPSIGEGWPKVLSEAMVYGVIPIASLVGSIPQNLTKFQIGKAILGNDVKSYEENIKRYIQNTNRWKIESERAKAMSLNFTYGKYLSKIRSILNL